MKRGLASVLALVLCVTCSACGAAPTGEQQSTAGTTAQATVSASVGENTTTPSSTTTTTGAQTQNPAENEYTRALAAIDKGEYQTAYELLSGLKGNKDAERLLGRFVFMWSGRSESSYDVRFDYTMEPKKLVATVSDKKTGAVVEVTTITFDSHGRVVCQERKDNSVHKTEWTYDSNGNVLTQKSGQSLISYRYDSQGNVIEKKHRFDSGAVDVVVYTYDSNGNLSSEVESSQGSDITTTTTYTYDQAGNNLRREEVITGHEPVITEWTYDASGRVLTEKETYIANGSQEFWTELTMVYNAQGNKVSRQFLDASGAWAKYTYSYNTDNQRVKEVFENWTGEKTETVYTYDINGNPTGYRKTTAKGTRTMTLTWQPVYLPDGVSRDAVEQAMPKRLYEE